MSKVTRRTGRVESGVVALLNLVMLSSESSPGEKYTPGSGSVEAVGLVMGWAWLGGFRGGGGAMAWTEVAPESWLLLVEWAVVDSSGGAGKSRRRLRRDGWVCLFCTTEKRLFQGGAMTMKKGWW